MANLLDKILADKDQKTKEQLEVLLVAARARLAQFTAELKASFLNPDATSQIEVVGNRAIEWNEEYRVNTRSGSDPVIDGIIDDFFMGTDQSLKAGFSNIIKVAIKTILGDASRGEIQSRQFLIVPEYNAFVKVDFIIWRYNFTSTGIVSDVEDAMCFVFCKSIIDHTTLTIDELIYFVSKMFGTDLNLPSTQEYLNAMRQLWASMSDKPPNQVMAEYYSARQIAAAMRKQKKTPATRSKGAAPQTKSKAVASRAKAPAARKKPAARRS